MIGNTNGAVVDLYREQIWNNPASYATNVSDNFLQNAVKPLDPLHTTRALTTTAYSTQQTTDSWAMQLKQKLIQL